MGGDRDVRYGKKRIKMVSSGGKHAREKALMGHCGGSQKDLASIGVGSLTFGMMQPKNGRRARGKC